MAEHVWVFCLMLEAELFCFLEMVRRISSRATIGFGTRTSGCSQLPTNWNSDLITDRKFGSVRSANGGDTRT